MATGEQCEWKPRYNAAVSAMLARDYETAVTEYSRALTAAETESVSAAELADTLEGLAGTRKQLDANDEVDELFDRAEVARHLILDHSIAHYGERDPRTANAYRRFAMHNIKRQRPTVAVAFLEKTLEVQKAYYGVNDFEVANTLTFIGGIHPDRRAKRKFWEQAVEILDHLNEHPEETTTKAAPYVSRSLQGNLENLAGHAYEDERLDEAEAYFRRAAALCKPVSSERTCRLCNANSFAKVLLAKQKYGEAEELLLDILESADRITRHICGETLADLYEQTDRPDASARLRASLSESADEIG